MKIMIPVNFQINTVPRTAHRLMLYEKIKNKWNVWCFDSNGLYTEYSEEFQNYFTPPTLCACGKRGGARNRTGIPPSSI